MKQLSPSEWLIVQPPLLRLADYVTRQIDSAAALASMYVGPKLLAPALNYDGPFFLETGDSAREKAGPNFVRKEFREAYEALRRYGRSTEANKLIRLYGNTSENALDTLQYVEALLVELEPPTGPIPPDLFHWEGKEYRGLKPISFGLLRVLWEEKTVEYSTLGESVWDDHTVEPEKEQVGTARRAINAFFKENGIPFQVAVKGLFVSLKDAPRNLKDAPRK